MPCFCASSFSFAPFFCKAIVFAMSFDVLPAASFPAFSMSAISFAVASSACFIFVAFSEPESKEFEAIKLSLTAAEI